MRPCPATLADYAKTEPLLAAVCLALLPDQSSALPEERVLTKASDTAAEVPQAVLDDVRAGIAAGADPLGDVFCQLRSPEQRRDLGQFYTPGPVVDAMCQWVLDQVPARAVDGGCGSGRYAVALARAGFTGQILAVDVDPLATLMTRAHAAVADIPVTVLLESFLGLTLPDCDGATAWFGNPPYLRHHNLPQSAKAWAKSAARELGVSVSGLAGLHALFFLQVAHAGREGDVGCLITSSEWFDARYGQVVRDLLTAQVPLERLDVVPPETSTFTDAQTTAVITSFRVGGELATPQLSVIDDPADLAELSGGIDLAAPTLAGARWSALLDGTAEAQVPDGYVRLGEHVRVSRGLATGNNKFFAPTRADADRDGLGAYAVPLVAKAAEIFASDGAVSVGDLSRVLLDLPSVPDEALSNVLAAAEARGVHEGYICSHRAQWWRVAPPAPAPALATYMARQAPKFALNPEGAQNLNTVHGLRPVGGFPAELLPTLVAWLNEHRDELVGGRVYAGGLRKVEPRDMEDFLVPSLEELERLREVPQ